MRGSVVGKYKNGIFSLYWFAGNLAKHTFPFPAPGVENGRKAFPKIWIFSHKGLLANSDELVFKKFNGISMAVFKMFLVVKYVSFVSTGEHGPEINRRKYDKSKTLECFTRESGKIIWSK